jgi:hypothetical protein
MMTYYVTRPRPLMEGERGLAKAAFWKGCRPQVAGSTEGMVGRAGGLEPPTSAGGVHLEDLRCSIQLSYAPKKIPGRSREGSAGKHY